MSNATQRTFAIAFLGLLLAVAAVLFAFGSPGDSRADVARHAAQQVARAQVSPGRAGGTYSVLAGTRTALDDISSWRVSGPAELGLRIAEAKVVDRNSMRTLAVVPSAGLPCFAEKYANGTSGLGCGSDTGIAAAISYTGSVGLVADTVKAVTYTMTDGSTVEGSVKSNLWKAPLEAKTVTFTENGQKRVVELMPPSEMPAGTEITPDGTMLPGDAPGNES